MAAAEGPKDSGLMEIKVVDSRTGQPVVYRSLEEMPTDVRARVEPLLRQSETGESAAPVMVRDARDARVGYSSENEMPDDVRRLVEQARQGRDGEAGGEKVVIWKTRRPERVHVATSASRNHVFYGVVFLAVVIVGAFVAWMMTRG